MRCNIAAFLEKAEVVAEERERLLKERDDLLAVNTREAEESDARLAAAGAYVAQQNADMERAIEEAARDAGHVGPLPDIDQAGDLSLNEERAVKQQVATLAAAEQKEHELTKGLNAKLAWFTGASEELRRVSGIQVTARYRLCADDTRNCVSSTWSKRPTTCTRVSKSMQVKVRAAGPQVAVANITACRF